MVEARFQKRHIYYEDISRISCLRIGNFKHRPYSCLVRAVKPTQITEEAIHLLPHKYSYRLPIPLLLSS